jgi:3'(2'), 5'-bisphosphate nucleotidase
MRISALKEAAREAIEAATKIAVEIYDELHRADGHGDFVRDKEDKSPVTLADLCCQFVIMRALDNAFPGIPFVAEESIESVDPEMLAQMALHLREPLDYGLLAHIFGAATPNDGREPVLFWALDPIDGTRGFLLSPSVPSGQYCICLALMERNPQGTYDPILGMLSCPNLPDSPVLCFSEPGDLPFLNQSIFAHRQLEMVASLQEAKVIVPRINARSKQIPRGAINELQEMDSQCKYVQLCTGAADIYYRPLEDAGYREKIWDHAPGVLLTRLCGGSVHQLDGTDLIFRYDRFLPCSRGLLAFGPQVTPAVKDDFFKLIETMTDM